MATLRVISHLCMHTEHRRWTHRSHPSTRGRLWARYSRRARRAMHPTHTHTHSVTHSLTHTLTHTHPELGVSHASGGAQVVEVADDGVRSAFGVLRVVRHAGLRVWYSLIYVCMYVCVYVCIYLYIYIHICRYMYVYICRYVCIHTYIHTFNTYMCIYNRAK